ncbi:MAG: hypothetical protein AAF282_05125 [Cyanobacteria bacterium P01_A01_bin.15]
MTQPSLRPGEILRTAFNRVGSVFVPVALLALPANVLPLLMPTPALSATFSFAFAILIGPILGGASIVLVDRALSGEKMDIGTALSMAWQRAGQLILTSLLLLVILIPSFALLLIPGIYLSVRLFAAQYEVMLERKSPTEAMEVSWALTKNRWWQIFVPILVITLVFLVPIMLVSAIFANAPLGELITALVGIAATPVLLLAILLIYKGLKGQSVSGSEDTDPLNA